MKQLSFTDNSLLVIHLVATYNKKIPSLFFHAFSTLLPYFFYTLSSLFPCFFLLLAGIFGAWGGFGFRGYAAKWRRPGACYYHFTEMLAHSP